MKTTRFAGRCHSFTCLIFFLFSAGRFCAQVSWVNQAGGLEGDAVSGIACDVLGNVYTVGSFSGTSSFGNYNLSSAGKGDIFVSKTRTSDGDVQWVKGFGSISEDNGNAIACDAAGNVYCTGRFNGTVTFGTFTLSSSGTHDIFLIKLDAAGLVTWAKRLGGGGVDGGLGITCDPSGNVAVTGYFQGTAAFGSYTLQPAGSNANIFVCKADGSTGTVTWANSFGNAGYTYGTSVACDVSGDVYLTGYFESLLVMGTTTLTAVQYQDVLVAKLDGSNGNLAWATGMGGVANDSGNDLTVNTDGNIYVIGRFEAEAVFGTHTLTSEGSADIFICRLAPASGTIVWVKQIGSGGYEQANSITHDSQGNLFLTGQFSGIVNFGGWSLNTAGNADIFIAKIDPLNGQASWAMSMGGTQPDSGYGIALDETNGLYSAGNFLGNASFEDYSFTSRGGADMFIIRLNSLTVGMEDPGKGDSGLTLMPVPCTNVLNAVLEQPAFYLLEIRDVFGKVQLQTNSHEARITLDMTSISPGIYFVCVTTTRGTRFIKKMVKE